MTKKNSTKKITTKPPPDSQVVRISDALVVIAPNVTATDRSNACNELNIKKGTISKYLKGDVANIDTGLDLLAFFTNRITAREQRLQIMNV